MVDAATELERERRISNTFLELEDARRELEECKRSFQNLRYLYVRILMAYGTIKVPKKILEDTSTKGSISREDDPDSGDMILMFKKANGKTDRGSQP